MLRKLSSPALEALPFLNESGSLIFLYGTFCLEITVLGQVFFMKRWDGGILQLSPNYIYLECDCECVSLQIFSFKVIVKNFSF